MVNKEIVEKIFSARMTGNSDSLLGYLADNVKWTIKGNSPISRVFKGKNDFEDNALKVIRAKLATPIEARVNRIDAFGDLVLVEWDGKSTAKSGKPYNNSYCWILQFDAQHKIVEGTAYIDTQLVTELLS